MTFFSEQKKTGLPLNLMTFLLAGYLLFAFNSDFFSTVAGLQGGDTFNDRAFLVSGIIVLWVIFNWALSLLGFPYLFKPVAAIILITAAVTSYFMIAYGVVMDKTMIQNVMETDIKETTELININLFIYVGMWGVLPAFIVIVTPIRYGSLGKMLTRKLIVSLVSTILLAVIAVLFYPNYVSLWRNHKDVRDLLLPTNYLYSTLKYVVYLIPDEKVKFTVVGADAKLGTQWQTVSDRKVVTVIVLGETARAQNFSLNGYARETNPNLKKRNPINYPNVVACGTSTAVSVPCMFSNLTREKFDNKKAKNRDNLLDVVQRAGINVLWRDNNSGCKGVCARVPYDDVSHLQNLSLCTAKECFDGILLEDLPEKIAATKGDVLIVLHQKGSHGPAYYLRVPPAFKTFEPMCLTNELQECKPSEIVNAYDNTILYTDYFVSQTIDLLKADAAKYDTALIYVSDHGESLGENNLYLHGLPYFMAPPEQTHVPFLMWISDSYAKRFALDLACLRTNAGNPYSHDNLFHSVLSLLDIQTSAYNPALDIFKACKI